MAKKGGLSAGDVAALYKHKNAVLDVKVDTESNVASCLFSFFKICITIFVLSDNSLILKQVCTTFTVTDILPSTKTVASLKLPDYKSGKVPVFLLHGYVNPNYCSSKDFIAIHSFYCSWRFSISMNMQLSLQLLV